MTPEIIGIDVGGTKILGARSDSSLRILQQIVLPTPETYDELLNSVSDVVCRLRQPGTLHLIGVACPGASDPSTGHIHGSNYAALKDKAFRDDLRTRLACDVVLENDANCFALAEATHAGHEDDTLVLGVVISTGIGCGIVNRGQILRGRRGLAGEWAHMAFAGPRTIAPKSCYCGNLDCTELFLNGSALVAGFGEDNGRAVTAEEIGELADRGDCRAQESLGSHAAVAGVALSNLCNFLDPDVLVVGGGLGRRLGGMRLFRDSVAKHLVNVSPRFLEMQLGDLGSVVGSLRLAWERVQKGKVSWPSLDRWGELDR